MIDPTAIRDIPSLHPDSLDQVNGGIFSTHYVNTKEGKSSNYSLN